MLVLVKSSISQICSFLVIGLLRTTFRFWTFSHLIICKMSIFKSELFWSEGSKRKINSKTHFRFFDHRKFLVDQFWPRFSRNSVVTTSLDLICIEVQMLNYRAVEVSDRSFIRLSRNQMIELNWSVEFKILGTIKRCKKILIKSYFLVPILYGSQNIKFYWPTQFNHLVPTQPNVGSIWNFDGSIVQRLNFNTNQI